MRNVRVIAFLIILGFVGACADDEQLNELSDQVIEKKLTTETKLDGGNTSEEDPD